MAHGAHFHFESRLMIEFHIRNARSGVPFRYLDRRVISSIQTSRAAGIWIFHAQTSFGSFEGGDVTLNIDFSKIESELAWVQHL